MWVTCIGPATLLTQSSNSYSSVCYHYFLHQLTNTNSLSDKDYFWCEHVLFSFCTLWKTGELSCASWLHINTIQFSILRMENFFIYADSALNVTSVTCWSIWIMVDFNFKSLQETNSCRSICSRAHFLVSKLYVRVVFSALDWTARGQNWPKHWSMLSLGGLV